MKKADPPGPGERYIQAYIRISRLTAVTILLLWTSMRSQRLFVLSEIDVCTSYSIEFIVGKIKFDAHFRRELEAFCRQVVGK